MKILIDTADVAAIEKLYQTYHFDGVTTNPRLLSRIQGSPMEILKEIRRVLPKGGELHVQVVSATAREMALEAGHILEALGEDTYIKVPASQQGYQVIRELAGKGVRVTATAIFNQIQAMLAAHEGAACLAPYIHQINNKGYDGMGTVMEIQRFLASHQQNARVLAAAFENAGQAAKVLAGGVESVTLAPDILEEMLANSLTENAVENFHLAFSRHFKQETM